MAGGGWLLYLTEKNSSADQPESAHAAALRAACVGPLGRRPYVRWGVGQTGRMGGWVDAPQGEKFWPIR